MQKIKAAVLAYILLITSFAAGCGAFTAAQSSGLIISEVVSSNSNSIVDPVLGKPDWVELYNSSSNAIDLLDYSIAESSDKKYTFPEASIGPGEYKIVYFCSPSSDEASDKLCTGFKLSKSGGLLILSSPKSTIQSLQVPPLETDISYGVTSEGSYAFFKTPTPLADNGSDYSDSLEGLKTSTDVKLFINEVIPEGISTSDPYGWVEIFNAGQGGVELSDYYISEDASEPTKAQLPKQKLGAGEYAVIKFTGNSGESQIPLKISGKESNIILSNNFGTQIDKLTWSGNLLPGISAGRGDNNTVVYYLTPTPGAKNGTDYITSLALTEGTGDIRINEMLLKNKYSTADSDGDRSPWVELFNTSGSKVSLSGFALSDDKDEPMKWRLPDVNIEANSYLIVFLSGKDKVTAGGELHTSFKPGNEDTELCLTNIKQGLVQTVSLPKEKKDNVSYGLSSDGTWLFYPQPTPSAPNEAKGFTQISDIKTDSSGLKINEAVTVNRIKSGKPDWIEIYNSSSKSVNLNGYYLSDSSENLKKWPLSNTTLKAGGYAVIEKYKGEKGTAYISVSLTGETLFLSNSQGEIIDSFDTGVLRPGYSSGLKADGTRAIFKNPTKGKANGGSTLQGCCSEPVFSEGGGHKSGTVKLTITTATKGADIYYTTNGSTPGSGSTKYNGPLTISSNKTVKAIAVKSGMMSSSLMVATYLFDKPHTLPVVCLSISSSDLRTVSHSSRKVKHERIGYVEYYESDGSLGVRFPAGLRIAGAGTLNYKQKSFNLYLRGGYGQSSVTYPFFENYNTTTFKSISLRNMGAWQDPSRLRDVFLSMAVNGMNIDNAQSKFAAVYINGKYWGLYEFKENLNQDYYASKYGIDPDKIVMVRGNKFNVNTKNGYKVVPDMVKLLALAKRNINGTSNWKKFTSLSDSDYTMDYLIAETFFFCNDTYNQKFAHTSDNTLKWRPVYYDFDLSFRSSAKSIFKLMTQKEIHRASGFFTDVSIYNAYYRNPAWRKAFVKRYAYVLNNILTTDKLLTIYNGLADSIKDEVPRTIKKWGMPSSVSSWKSQVSSTRSIIKNRRKHIISQLKNLFNLSSAEIKELFPNG